jgi:hypothetical protein
MMLTHCIQFAAGVDAAESKLCPSVVADLEIGRLDHIEI